MIADTVISVCALGLTIWTIQQTHRQNKLSARPHIVGNHNSDWNDTGCLYTYEISNHGIGPARLKRFILVLDGEAFECPKDKHPMEEFFAKHLTGKLEYKLLTTGVPNADYCMLAGQSYKIFNMLIPGVTMDDRVLIRDAMKGMDLRVEYESFYEEKFVFDTRDKSA